MTTRRPWRATTVAAITLVIVIACGGGNSDQSASQPDSTNTANQRIINSEATLTVDDLINLGMKQGKEYDVSTLNGATAAYLLFWRVQSVAVEYEIRFYSSHDDAVNLGTALAQEGSGPDAIIDIDDATYKEGIRDRRTIFDFRAEPKPKYGAYGIYANAVMLCEGRDDEEAWNRCQALINALSMT